MKKVENHTLSNHNHHHPSSINQINHHLLTSINHIIHPFFRKAPLEPLKPAGEAPPPTTSTAHAEALEDVNGFIHSNAIQVDAHLITC